MNQNINCLSGVTSSGESVKHQIKPADGTYTAPVIDHWVLQVHGIPAERINDTDRLQVLLEDAVRRLNLTQVSSHSHYFGPGVSTVIILSESHLSVHTWPELGYMHVDIVTCVKQLTPEKVDSVFRDLFQPEFVQVVQLEY